MRTVHCISGSTGGIQRIRGSPGADLESLPGMDSFHAGILCACRFLEAHLALPRHPGDRAVMVDLLPQRALYAHRSAGPCKKNYRRAALVRRAYRSMVHMDGYAARRDLTLSDAGYCTSRIRTLGRLVVCACHFSDEQFWHLHRALRTPQLVGYSAEPGGNR